eukprot:c22536_g1_i1 orf=131-2425(+)
MQSGGERYGLGQAYTGGAAPGGSGAGGGGSGTRGLSHLFGHPQTSSDLSGLHTLHLYRPGVSLHQQQTEQQYIDLSQHLAMSGNQPQQGANPFLHPGAGMTAHHHVASFFKASQGPSLSGQHQVPPDTSSHSFFNMGSGHNGSQDQFKRSYNNQQQLQQDEDASASQLSLWRADETAALLKVYSDMDSSAKAPALWEDVARKLQEIGYQRSPQKCKEKFESLHKPYKKGKEENQRRELEFSSDFSSEGGHAANVQQQNSENYDNDGDDQEEEDTDQLQEAAEENPRKRKMISSSRSSWAPSKSFFERLTREIMEKQEGLHRAFLETIERKERERTQREEAYRREEAARLDREQEIRAREVSITASRDAALIAFLEKATGSSLSSMPKITGFAHAVPPLSSSTPTSAAAAALMQQPSDHHLLHQQALQDAADMDNNSDLNTKRWPKVEVHALIRLRSGMEPRFREAGPKAHLWQEISASMACLGFIRSPKRCKEKWENINKYFKKTKDSSKKRPENAKTCPYFHQLDTLYQRGILTSSSASAGSAGGKVLGKSDNLLEYNTQEDEDGFNMQNTDGAMQGGDHRDGNAGGEIQHAELHIGGRDKDINNDQVSMLDTSQNSIFVSNLYHSNASNAGASAGTGGSGTGTTTASMVSLPQQMALHHHNHHHEGLNINALSSKKSLQVEMFVKDILDLQQQQHQKLVDEYDRMEQAHELRELERQQIKTSSAIAVHPHANSHDNATLMALVHKLAGDSSDLTMSAPSSME